MTASVQGIARHATAAGTDPTLVAADLAAQLGGSPDLRFAIVFADWRLDPAVLARELHAALQPAQVVGCTTIGVVGAGSAGASAAALGLYGDWLRVGVGLAAELSKSPLSRSRDAVRAAAAALELAPEDLTSTRHAAITLVDGNCGHEEAFCIGSAAAAPQIRFVGGSAATNLATTDPCHIWVNGEAVADAGLVVVLDSALPMHAVTSSHLIATTAKTVVTAATGRIVEELDGRPASQRLRELIAQLGGALGDGESSGYSLARFVGGMPYVRSMTGIDGPRIALAAAVEPGHVLRLMKPGDLIAQTRHDLGEAAKRVGGEMAAFLAFSCIGRHSEAARRGIAGELAAAYADYPTTGFQSYGEQTGMLLVNHTLTGLAIGTK